MDLFFIVSKIVHYFLLPPGLFVVIFLLAGYFAKRAKVIFYGMAVLTYLLSTEYFYDSMLNNQNKVLEINDTNSSFEAVVVLGLGVDEDSLSFELPPESLKNFLYALYLGKTNNVPVIFSGKGTKNISESKAARNSLEKITTIFNSKSDDINIMYENNSLNTYENATYTKKLLDDLKIKNKNIALVTSSWHVERAREAFEEVGVHCVVKLLSKENINLIKKEYNVFSFIPQIIYLKRSHNIIKEYLGSVALKIKGNN